MGEDEGGKVLEALARTGIQELERYVPGRTVEEVERRYGLTDVIKLAANENAWGASPKAVEAVRGELPRLCQYPEGSCRELRLALSRRLGVTEDMISVSNGADHVLMMIAQAFFEPEEEVVMARPTFPIYRSATHLMGAVPVEIPLQDFKHDLPAIREAVGSRTKAVIICNPNNPTGTIVDRDGLNDLIADLSSRILLVIDEVYGDFASSADLPDVLELIRMDGAVLSVRSFSKLYGLAGLRVGYAVGPAALIQALERVREPFAVNRLAQAAAVAALEDEAFRAQVLLETKKGRDFLAEALQGMGLRCLPSHTNFVFVDLAADAQEVFEALLRRGIIIRPGTAWGTPSWCRITVGTAEQNERVVAALKEVLEEADCRDG